MGKKKRENAFSHLVNLKSNTMKKITSQIYGLQVEKAKMSTCFARI